MVLLPIKAKEVEKLLTDLKPKYSPDSFETFFI